MTTKERPILFSAPMVRALLDGRKTQTRRVVKPQPSKLWGQGVMQSGPKRGRFCAHAAFEGAGARADMYIPSPYGAPGDRLWVRETAWINDERKHVGYCADPAGDYMGFVHARDGQGFRKVSSIHMPRWASRLTLELTDVRVERVQDISEADAMAEGCSGIGGTHYDECETPAEEFRRLWDSINTKRGYGWDANPWVWALTFKRVDA